MKQDKSFKDIEKEYELEINKIVETIKKQKAKSILLQFPDGLKPCSTVVAEEIEKRLKQEQKKKSEDIEIFIWFSSCFGACDLPLETEKLGIDLIIQFGHSDWDYSRKDIKVL